MSLQTKTKNKSQAKRSRKGKSLQQKQKISFVKQQSNDFSIANILQQTIKSANQSMVIQTSNYRQSKLAPNFQKNRSQKAQQISQIPIGKLDNYFWQIQKIEQKRKIKGIKAKIVWTNSKQSNRIVLRVIISDNYSRSIEPDYYVQLDSINFELSLQQQKLIQKNINRALQQEQYRQQFAKNQIFAWLKSIMLQSHNLFLTLKVSEKKRLKQTIQIKKTSINPNYILYPCPSSLTWSPHGMLCLSENKVGSLTKPIVGNIHSYRYLLQDPYKFERFAKKNNQINDLKMVDQRKEQEVETTEAQFFGWDVKQQISYSIFGRSTQQEIKQQSIQLKAKQSHNEKPQKRLLVKDHETFFMGNTQNIPPKIEKIYRRHFTGFNEASQFQFCDKLKIFMVNNQIAQLQDGISYLIDKIQRHNRFGVIQALIQNQFTGFHNVFHKNEKQNVGYEKLKYQIIIQFLQQKIKSIPQSQHFLYMKSVMLQNEFFRLALEDYINQSFKKIKIFDKKNQTLGTYDNFDDINAESALFFLIQQYIKAQKNYKQQAQKVKSSYRHKPQKYDDPQYKLRKYTRIQQEIMEHKLLLKGYVKRYPSNHNNLSQFSTTFKILKNQLQTQFLIDDKTKKSNFRNVNLNVMPFLVVNKVQFMPLHFNMILTPAQRKNFLQTVIPILWIKDRGVERFQYKIAKRVIIANAKIITFLDKLNSIVSLYKKVEGARRPLFLKTIIKQYHKFQQKKQIPLGKVYTAYCQGCQGDFTAYNIQQLLRVTKCSRCKYLQGIN